MRWRKTKDPYKILVSEIMLQQTQVPRVEKFYPKFVKAFPNFCVLARAPLKSVLRLWQGMGYNRRAIALKKLAQEVVEKHDGELSNTIEGLVRLPGIGQATAGAIMAYAFNLPVAFVETNIRRVFIFHFFSGPRNKSGMTKGKKVDDREILKLVEHTVDRRNSREWYWALMDYGTMLAAQEKENPNVRSVRYRKQPKFEGSRRQMRGRVLKLLVKKGSVSRAGLKEFRSVIPELLREGFIKEVKGRYGLA
jgi:A/G-specific adenine glycosylase